MRDNRASPDHGKAPNRISAHNGGISPDGGSTLHQGNLEFVFPLNESPRIDNIREHHGGAAENVIFKLNALIYGYVVLDLHAVADLHIVGNVHVLTEGAVLANGRSGLHMREVPDLGSGTDGNVVVYYAGGVSVVGHLC